MITRRSTACRMSLFLYYSIHARMKINKTENATSNENYYRSWILFRSCVNDRICLVLSRIFYYRSFAILSPYYFSHVKILQQSEYFPPFIQIHKHFCLLLPKQQPCKSLLIENLKFQPTQNIMSF